MSTIYRIYPMKFDTELWAERLAAAAAGNQAELAYILGIDPSTISGWTKQHYSLAFPYPSMTFFLNVCNLLDFNPQDFFCLDTDEANSDER